MRIVYKVLLMSILIVPLLSGCGLNKMEEHYKRPSWLKGSAYEVLSERGDYSLFLAATKRANFSILIEGQGLCTVFAPNDTQFRKYLDSHGWSSVEAVPIEELRTLIGAHIVEYSFSPLQLKNYQPGGAIAASGPAGVFYKQKTYGREPVKMMVDQFAPVEREVRVFMREKYLPILSPVLMKTKGLTDFEYSYKTLFPNSGWVGAANEQIYVANAYVLPGGEGIPTDNGYVYLVSEVLRPLDNIRTVMEKHPDLYSDFMKMYDRFATIKYNAAVSAKYGETSNDSLYLHTYGIYSIVPLYPPKMAHIASEWTFNETSTSSNQGSATGRAYNAFIPDNAALEAFVNEYFNGYSGIESLPLLHAYFLANSQILDNSPAAISGVAVSKNGIVLPEEVRNGAVHTVYGDVIEFDAAGSPLIQLCTNGVFYGSNKVIVPAPFKSVTKPVFRDPKYNVFLNLLYQTGNILQLTNSDVNFTLFIPTDDAMSSSKIQLSEGNIKVLGDEVIQIDKGAGFEAMDVLSFTELVDMHIIFQKITDFNTKMVYPAKRSHTFVKTFGGGITGEPDQAIPIHPTFLGTFSNGLAYELPSVLSRSQVNMADIFALSTTQGGKFTKFFALLKKAGLINVSATSVLTMPSISGELTMIFAPNDAALPANHPVYSLSATVPAGSNDVINNDLARYLQGYIVSLTKSKVDEYLIPGVGVNGQYATERVDKTNLNPMTTVYYPLHLTVDVANCQLKVENNNRTASTLTTIGKFPDFGRDGIIYEIPTTEIQPVI